MENANSRKAFTRAQLLLLFLALTAAIATGLAIFSSVSTLISLVKTASAGLFLPLLLSMIAAFLLEPLVQFTERGKIGRTGSIFVVYFLVTAMFIGIFTWLVPHWQLMWTSLKSDLPRYLGQMASLLQNLQIWLHSHFPFMADFNLPGQVRATVEKSLSEVVSATPKSALRLGSLFLIVPLFTFFFLRDGQRIMRACISMAPNRYFEMAHDLSYMVSRQMAQFIRGRLTEAMIIGLVVGIGLSFTDIRYAPLLGIFAGIANLIPYIGPLIGMVPGLLIALVDLGIGPQFWWILTVYLLIAQVIIDNFILIPILISRASDLHPLLVILAIIMGGKLYGILGMIIGVPVVSIIKIAVTEIYLYRNAFSLPETLETKDCLPDGR